MTPDRDLIDGIESTDAFGIEGDAIEITGVSTLDGELLADFTEKGDVV